MFHARAHLLFPYYFIALHQKDFNEGIWIDVLLVYFSTLTVYIGKYLIVDGSNSLNTGARNT